MVTGPADLEAVTLGEGGLLTGEWRPRVLVDCSTVSETASPDPAAAAAAGVSFLAAPVCGNWRYSPKDRLSSCPPADTFQAVRPDLSGSQPR
jgi:3-hydroxyisobutyrate dehydrogenase-like beta-hydroxyacid dehydrogenase